MGTDIIGAPGQPLGDHLTKRQRIDALGDRIASLAATLDATTHAILSAIRQFDADKGWAVQGAKSCARWLTWRTGRDPHTAREWVRVAKALGELPAMDEALRRGEVSYTKVRAMTRVADASNEDLLLDQAKTATGGQLERVCQGFEAVQRQKEKSEHPEADDDRREVRRRNKRDGTVIIEARLMPDEAELVMQALHAMKERLADERASADERAVADERASADERAGADDGAENVPAGTSAAGEANGLASENVPAGTSPECDSSNLPHENVPAGTPADVPGPSLADALVALAERQLEALEEESASPSGESASPSGESAPSSEPRRRRPRRELLVHLRRSDLVGDAWTAELHDGTVIDGATFQRLACDSGIVVAQTDGRGDPLDVGRRRRTVPPPLMRALLLRDRRCRFPGCEHQAFVEAHHLDHWSEGGETNKDNLVLVCRFHHVALHEGGFSAERTADGSLRFCDRRGRNIPEVPEPSAPAPAAPHPDPHANLIDWDGRRADIRGAVRALTGR